MARKIKTREQELWGLLSRHAESLESNPEDEISRSYFWNAMDLMFSHKESQRFLEPKLAKPCQRDKHEGFRCILAAGHPPPCVFEEWNL